MNRYAKKVVLLDEAKKFILPWVPPSHRPGAATAPAAPVEPFNQGSVFGNRLPLEIEVGFGTGKFLTAYAGLHPDRNLLGVEITRKMVMCVANKLLLQNIPNVRLVQGDARAYMKNQIIPASVAKIHVYFPDPWPKKRHRKRRVINQDFLENAFRVLTPGGTLLFATDHVEYFDYFNEERNRFGQFESAPAELAPLPTSYELKWLSQGRKIFRSALLKGVPQ